MGNAFTIYRHWGAQLSYHSEAAESRNDVETNPNQIVRIEWQQSRSRNLHSQLHVVRLDANDKWCFFAASETAFSVTSVLRSRHNRHFVQARTMAIMYKLLPMPLCVCVSISATMERAHRAPCSDVQNNDNGNCSVGVALKSIIN